MYAFAIAYALSAASFRLRKMKILIVSLRGPTNAAKRGGAQDYIRFIGQYLVNRGHQVEIICGDEAPIDDSLPQNELVDDVTVNRLPVGRSRFFALCRAVRAREGDFDVILENVMGFPLFLPLFGGRSLQGRLFAIKHHFEGRNFFNSQGLVKGGLGILFEYLLQPMIYRSVRWIAVSDATKQTLQNAIVKPRWSVEKVPPGIHAPKTLGVVRSMEPSLLYYGALDVGRKRVDHLLQAFAAVVKKFPTARLYIGGTGPSEQQLKEQARGLNVSFEGFLSESRKQELLEMAWMFVSPSNSEGFGITWIEANAAGMPVVGYELGLDTVNPACAVMVEENNVDELAKAMQLLIEDGPLRQQMGVAGIKNAKRFSWQSSGEQLEKLLTRQIVAANR